MTVRSFLAPYHPISESLMVETGHFPSWPLIEIRNPCSSSSQTFSTVPAFPLVRATDLPIKRARASWYALRIVAACGTSTSQSLFFANKGFGAFAGGASKLGEVRAIFPGFVNHDLHRSLASCHRCSSERYLHNSGNRIIRTLGGKGSNRSRRECFLFQLPH